jgi:hypothetical protein
MWPLQNKLDEEKSKHAISAQQNASSSPRFYTFG